MKKDYSQFRNISIENGLPIFFVKNRTDKEEDSFEKLGIKTLEDLFTEYDKGTFNDNRKKFNREIKGQTALLLFHYMGIPFCGEGILNQEIPMNNIVELQKWFHNKEIKDALNRIGITDWEQMIIHNYCVSSQKKSLIKKTPTLIEVMEKIDKDKYYLKGLMANKNNEDEFKTIRNLMFKISFFKTYMKERNLFKKGKINSYELNTIADLTTMHELKHQLDILIYAKKAIEDHMLYLETQMSNIDNAVVIRKQKSLIKK